MTTASRTSICVVPRPESTCRDAHPPLAILLDLGGVLIDVSFERTLQYWRANAQKAADKRLTQTVEAKRAGVATQRSQATLASTLFADQAYEDHERGAISFAYFANALQNKLQLNLPEEQWRHGWNAALGHVLPGAIELIHSIAEQWPVFLFSNTNATHHAQWREQHRNLLSPMRAVFVSNELGLRKPDPQAFAAVAMHIGVAANRIFFFDDREDNVAGARAAGLPAFQVNGPADVTRILATHMPARCQD
ncbi:MAG: HAD superfamily hydrolase (TIGR01509 family) [Gammaproteobacteria bacterium]|jgi:HAD superfamily hydrolase (TIGR01509 family)